jgi:hypothetical protein
MNRIRIGSSERELSDANENWIVQQVREREHDGQSVCVQVVLKDNNVDMVLSTPQCGGGSGGGRPPNQKEAAIFQLWNERHLNQNNWAVGDLIAFLKQIRKFF